jgi:hypothetical protein
MLGRVGRSSLPFVHVKYCVGQAWIAGMGQGRKRKPVQNAEEASLSKESNGNVTVKAVQRKGKGMKRSNDVTASVIVDEVVRTDRKTIIENAESIGVIVETTTKKSKKQKSRALEVSISDNELPTLRAKAAKIYEKLMELYEDPPCPLDHENDFQLLVAIILSAQSTDKKARPNIGRKLGNSEKDLLVFIFNFGPGE